MITSYRLQVDELHNLYVEEQGSANGVPILFLHGGPGTGISPSSSRYFDPSYYRIILFDQRGAGQSTPFASLEINTTQHLIEDIEKIRYFLKIETWLIFGGSWGSLLALAYAQAFPEKVKGLILRGIFLCNDQDLRWLLYDGAPQIWPHEWQQFISLVEPEHRHNLIEAYWALIHSADPLIVQNAVRNWALWEARNLCLENNLESFSDFYEENKAIAITRIELHYFRHKAFLQANQILNNCFKLSQIPMKIIHGRYDTICPLSNAYQLHQKLPHAQLIIVEAAGHAGLDPGIKNALINVMEQIKNEPCFL
jgi:proline iminopeptidase